MFRLLKPIVPATKALSRPKISPPVPSLVRGKRTQKLAPGASRIITMLSVLSARKKQPRRLKLCREDLIRHQTVQAAYRLFMRDARLEQTEKLRAQHANMVEACTELEKLDYDLFKSATEREKGKRFPIELRVPTDTPPRTQWREDWTPRD